MAVERALDPVLVVGAFGGQMAQHPVAAAPSVLVERARREMDHLADCVSVGLPMGLRLGGWEESARRRPVMPQFFESSSPNRRRVRATAGPNAVLLRKGLHRRSLPPQKRVVLRK